MRISLSNMHLVRWLGSLGILLLLSSRGFSQTGLEGWIDTVSGWVESYDKLTKLAEQNKHWTSEFDLETVLDELDRRREESRIDCLANRLLAEEYTPYDFDIRETMWCKGTLNADASNLCPAEAALAEDLNSKSDDFSESAPYLHARPQLFSKVLGAEWIARVRSQVWEGFETQMQSHWEHAKSYFEFATDTLRDTVAAIDSQRIVNEVAQSPSLRSIFGRSVLPNKVGLTSEEYSKIAIKIWKDLQAHAEFNGILSRSPWFELKTNNLKPLYDLVTVIPVVFGKNHR